MPQAIPERIPVEDRLTGVVFQVGPADGLALVPQPNTLPVAQGPLVVRYGVRFLGKRHQSIVPGLVVLDYGDMLTGEDAWDFLQKRSNLHPRAEVAGYRDDGRDDMVFVRALDLAIAPQVLVFADAASNQPIARPRFLIAPPDAALPLRVLNYLPRYDSLAAWQAEESQ
jgi:hypothetical protein